ncbi:unnamed protein product [Closterium sp. NIES-54]
MTGGGGHKRTGWEGGEGGGVGRVCGGYWERAMGKEPMRSLWATSLPTVCTRERGGGPGRGEVVQGGRRRGGGGGGGGGEGRGG